VSISKWNEVEKRKARLRHCECAPVEGASFSFRIKGGSIGCNTFITFWETCQFCILTVPGGIGSMASLYKFTKRGLEAEKGDCAWFPQPQKGALYW